jgi:hypothetical protein
MPRNVTTHKENFISLTALNIWTKMYKLTLPTDGTKTVPPTPQPPLTGRQFELKFDMKIYRNITGRTRSTVDFWATLNMVT